MPCCRLNTVCVLLVSLLASTAMASIDVVERIRGRGAVVIAHREASIPFSYLDEKKVPVGYAIDICMRLVEALRARLRDPLLRVEFMPVTSANRIAAISEGRADLECGSTTNTAERREKVAYTTPHFMSSARMLARTASAVRRIEDLRGKTVVSTAGTTNLKQLHRLNQDRSLNMTILAARDHAEAFEMVRTGKAIAFAMDDVLLYGLRATAGNPQDFIVTGERMNIEPYAIMLSKDDLAFKQWVDTQMADLISRGDLHRIYQKWFESPIAPGGINLQVPMPRLLRESLFFPTDKVND